MNISYLTQFSLPIKGGCVVTCIVGVDVTATPDEMAVGAIVDPPVVEDENNMVIFLLNVSPKEKPYTTQTAINCMVMFYKTSLLKSL